MASGDHVWTAGSMPKQSIAAFLSSEPNSQVSQAVEKHLHV
jgi:cephalosporin hydroxylase